MSITILQRSSKGMRSIQLHNAVLWSVAFITLLIVTSAGVSGYYFGDKADKQTKVEQLTIDNWQKEIDLQWLEIRSAKGSSQQKIDALTARLGLLQAHVTRLDAAGERILSIAGIDKAEFNFSQAPAIGGPVNQLEPVSQNDLNTSNPSPLSKPISSISDLNDVFNNVGLSLQSREQQFKVIESLLMDKHMGVERYISGRPTTKGWLSSFYGERNDPFTGKPAWHEGIDFAASEGDEVISTAAGVVSWVGVRSGYGLLIEINHGDGLVTRYGHNQKALVAKGAVVKKGQAISTMGNSGRSTGAHVHYEVLINGKAVNPTRYVNRKSS